jgi:competence ComEA-like helix-hairpin-helix protein
MAPRGSAADDDPYVAAATRSDALLSPPQQRTLMLLLAAAVLALGIPLLLPSGPRVPVIAPASMIELPDAVVLMPRFLEGTSQGLVVNVNTAGARALETLPGIGPVLAERIVAHRSEYGPFDTPEDLLEVSGIGPATFAGFRDRITVTDASEEDADPEPESPAIP